MALKQVYLAGFSRLLHEYFFFSSFPKLENFTESKLVELSLNFIFIQPIFHCITTCWDLG